MQVETRVRVKNDEGDIIAETTHMNETGERAETIEVQQTLFSAVFGAFGDIAKKKLDGTLDK